MTVSAKNLGALVLVLTGLAGSALWAYVGEYVSGMMGMMYGWGYVRILPFAVIGLLAVVAYVVLTELVQPRSGNPTPLIIVNERYARGEITREQYLQVKRELDA